MENEELKSEMQEKAKACKTQEELAELSEASGCELSDGVLGDVAGGRWDDECADFNTCTSKCGIYHFGGGQGLNCTWVIGSLDGPVENCGVYGEFKPTEKDEFLMNVKMSH